MENGETKLVGEGHKWYHKTPNADILSENDKTKLTAEGPKQYHKEADEVGGGTYGGNVKDEDDDDDDPSESPCSDDIMTYAYCLRSEGMSEDQITACAVCLDEAISDLEEGTMCLDLEEVGYCDDVFSCEANECNNECTDEITTAQACIAYYSGCTQDEFNSECLSGI